jgi:repressor LexA
MLALCRTNRERFLRPRRGAWPRESPTQNVAYLLQKRRHATWHPVLEPLALATESGVEIPLLGYVTAGQPVDIPEERETVTVPRHMVRKNSYALRVRGHSMIDDHIQDGDIIIVEQRATAENGESVVAMINGERVTLKRFYVEADGIRLQPANPAMEPIYLRHDELQILGIVAGVIRQS